MITFPSQCVLTGSKCSFSSFFLFSSSCFLTSVQQSLERRGLVENTQNPPRAASVLKVLQSLDDFPCKPLSQLSFNICSIISAKIWFIKKNKNTPVHLCFVFPPLFCSLCILIKCSSWLEWTLFSDVVKAEADESRLKSLHSPALFSVKVQPHTSLCCYLQKQNVNCFVTLRQHGRRADIGVLLCKVTKTPPLIW